jgi:large subunit ribosomal protein L10
MAKLGREARKRRGLAPKKAAVAEVVTALKAGQGFILLNNKGLTLGQATNLRARARDAKVYIKVVKNTLLRRALDQVGVDSDSLKHLLKRETVLAIGLEDPVTPAKLLTQFVSEKDNDKLEIKGGYLDGKVLDATEVDQLSKLPGRDELLGRLLGSISAPAQNFVYALNAVVSKPVYLLDAIKRQKEEQSAA